MKNITTILILIIILSIVGFYYLLNKKVEMVSVEQPFHKLLNKDCNWVRRKFPISGISFYEAKCSNSTSDQRTYFENETGKIMMVDPSNNDKAILAMEVLNKDSKKTPQDIMSEWYAKLTKEQQQQCSIQNADMPLERFEGIEVVHKTPHKIRFEIGLKKEVVKLISEKYDIDALFNPKFSYLCGNEVGSLFNMSSPYFEFDDRSPSKYLFIHLSWNDQGPNIDLNTIKF